MNRVAVLAAITASGLPEPVKRYLAAFVRSGADSTLRRALRADPAGLSEKIRALLSASGKALGLADAEVLFVTGFDAGNMAPERFEAALAELSAVTFLESEGFERISFIPRTVGRTADLAAFRGGNTYALEVRCVTGKNSPAAGDLSAGFDEGAVSSREKAVSLLKKKYRRKMPQAAASRKRGGFSHCCLVFVINTCSLGPAGEWHGLDDLAASLYEGVGRPAAVHICILAGGGALAVAPAWGA